MMMSSSADGIIFTKGLIELISRTAVDKLRCWPGTADKPHGYFPVVVVETFVLAV